MCTPYWDKRLINKNYDKVIIKLGYPKDSEKEKILIFNYRGYEIQEILHEHFGKEVVQVYAIKLHEDIKTCANCGRVLTKEEIEYYHNFCDNCESEIHNELMSELYNVR